MAKFDIDIPKTEKAISKFESVEKTIIQSVVQMSDSFVLLDSCRSRRLLHIYY